MDLGRHAPAGVEHHLDRQRCRLKVLQDNLQLPGRHRRRDLIGQHPRHAPAQSRQVDRRIVRGDHQARFDGHRQRLAALGKGPFAYPLAGG